MRQKIVAEFDSLKPDQAVIYGQKVKFSDPDNRLNEQEIAEVLSQVTARINEIQKKREHLAPQQVLTLLALELAVEQKVEKRERAQEQKAIQDYRQKLDQKCESLLQSIDQVAEPIPQMSFDSIA